MNPVFRLISLLFLVVTSCSQKRNERLLSFDYKFLRDLHPNEIGQINTGKDIDYKITKEQNGDTLSVTVDFAWSGCAKMDGDLNINADSLYLFYMLKDPTLCSEIIYYRLNYNVLNKERKDYFVSVQYKRNQ